MTTQKYILTLVFFLVALQTVAQEHDVIFSGDLRDLSFSEFVNIVEQQTGAHFFYLEDWFEGIKVSVSGEKISLQKTLSDALKEAELYFYIREDLQVFIIPEQAVITALPDYSSKNVSAVISTGMEADKEMSNIEQRYIEGIEKHEKFVILIRRIRFHDAAEFIRVAGGYTGYLPIEARKTGNQVRCKVFFQFEELTVVDDHLDNLVHIVGEFVILRHHIE